MKKKCLNPKELFNSTQYGFSQIVIGEGSKLVFISGQVGWDEEQNMIGENDLKKQTEKALDNLNLAIQKAGGTLENIVMLRLYIVDYQQQGSIISEALKKYFGTESPPASTWINVQGLASTDFLIEIEAQAILD